jgi:hypothetical protein
MPSRVRASCRNIGRTLCLQTGPRLDRCWGSVHAALGCLQHGRRQKTRFDRPQHPAPRPGPEGIAAGWATETLPAAAGSSRRERLPAPKTAGGHWASSRGRTPGPPPLPLMSLTPASSSARRRAVRMARRGWDTPFSNWRSVTTPTSASRDRSSWVQSAKARAARHWAGVTARVYHVVDFRQI